MDLDRLVTEADPARRIPLSGPDSPEAARLYQQITSHRAAAPPQARQRPRRPRPARPLLLTSATSAVLAAGLAVALMVTSGAARPPGSGASQAFGPASTAAAVLRNAALGALAVPAATPRPDQFVHSKMYSTMTCLPKPPAGHADRLTGVDQAWRSVSGTRADMGSGTGSESSQTRGHGAGSRPEPACRSGRVFPPSLTEPHLSRCPCTPADFAAYLPGMPTRPAGLRAWLDRRYHVSPGPAGVIYLLGITASILSTDYLTPAQHVAMYELLARTPGLKVVPKASTLLGRTGVGVRWTVRTGAANNRPVTNTFTLVFNRKTYQLLGMNWNLGDATGGEALIKLAIVNKAGQLP
jgi:hypothetical protein